ncbi:hypothetical protein FSP39_019230, partial [Pinctada imbricata]
QFDIWNLIKRPNTTEPYVLTTRYRVCKNPVRRAKLSLGIRRKRRPESRADSEGESNHSIATTEFDYDREYFCDEYDFDADPEDLADTKPVKLGTPSQELYKRACNYLKVTPISYFLRNMNSYKIIMPYHPLGIKGLKACCMALLNNSEVQVLDLTDCDIDVNGAVYIADLLRENHFITDLSLAENPLGIEGAKKILDVIVELDNIISLNLSGRVIYRSRGTSERKLNDETNHLRRLILSHNEFREVGGKLFGEYLSWNDTIEELDLSWNHLRNEGARELAEGLKDNRGLKSLDISWNGFYMKGCEYLAAALEKNTELLELNLNCNRISKDCLGKLTAGLRKNTTLKVLKLAWNPIMSTGAMDLLTTIEEKGIPLEELDIHTQLVETSFVQLAKTLEKDRGLRVRYGMVRGQNPLDEVGDDEFLMEENPSVVLMEFTRLMGFRPMDLLAAFDKDKSNSLDRQEIKEGLRVYCIPLSDRCLDYLIGKLDLDGDGFIDLAEIMSAKADHRLKESRMHKATQHNISVEDTEVGRVRMKLQKLMARKMDGNPTFRARVEAFRDAISQGELKSALLEKVKQRKEMKEAVLAKRQAKKVSKKELGSGDLTDSKEDIMVGLDTLAEGSSPSLSRADSRTAINVYDNNTQKNNDVRTDSRTGANTDNNTQLSNTNGEGKSRLMLGDRVPSALSAVGSRRSSRSSGLGSARRVRDQLPGSRRNSRQDPLTNTRPSSGALEKNLDMKLDMRELKGSTETLTPKSSSTLDLRTDRTTNREDSGHVKDWVPLNF